MTIKCNIFLEDIQLIHKHIDHFKTMFPLEIKSKSLIPDDEGTTYDGEPDDLFEVEFEMNNMNNFWFLAQLIGEIKYKNKQLVNG
jgi:hypothetical protein